MTFTFTFPVYSKVYQLCIVPLFWISFPFRSPESIEQSSLCCTIGPHWLLFYTQQCIYVNPNLPIHPTLPLLPQVSICLFSMSASQFLLCKQVQLYHFSRFHVYALINSICFSFYRFNSLFKHVLGICPLSYLVSLSPPEQICLLLIAVHFISMLACGFLCYSPSVFRLIHLFLSYRNFMSSLALWWLYSHAYCCRGFIATLLV